jgi:hypothetical protein
MAPSPAILSAALFNLPQGACMRFFRYVVSCSVIVGMGLLLGCGEDTKPMKNMKPGTGPETQMEMKLKAGKKPLPAEPPEPEAPPTGKSK